MSKSIDERVVEMRFDNAQFESGVKTSLSTLDRLKESLNFFGAGNALADLGSATTNISGMGNAVETVKGKFSILETVATGALLKIGSAAADAGMKILNQVNPLNQVTEGWNKYAEKTTSVQTIMAATRTTWEESAKALGYEGDQMGFVSEQLDKLNWFTDETSYGFTDMVNNIGKFTNNNIPLEQAVTSMEGIATWAGISGANVSDASRAMYNFSQAMGAGAMKLQDWKSIENANMATTEFKQAAIDTAIELGRLKEVEEGVYIATEQWGQMKPDTFTIESFSTQLKDLWMNKDVMTATLEKFGGFTDELNKFYGLVGDNYDTTSALLDDLDKYKEMSGDTAAQTAMLNEISEATGITVEDLRKEFDLLNSEEYDLGKRAFRAAQEAKTFKEAIESVADASSTAWMKVFEAIFGNYEQAKQLWTGLANSLWSIFVGPVDQLASVMQIWNGLGGRDDLLAGFSALGDAASAVFGSIKEGFESVFGKRNDDAAAKSLKDLTEKFKNFAQNIKPSEEMLNRIKTVATVVATVFQKLGSAVGKVGSFFLGAVKDILTFITTNERVQKLFDAIGKTILNFGTQIEKIGNKFKLFRQNVEKTEGFKKFSDAIDRVKKAIGDFIGAGVDKVIDFFERLSNFNVGNWKVSDLAKDFGTLLGDLSEWIDKPKEKFDEFIKSLGNDSIIAKVTSAFGKLKDTIAGLAGSAWSNVTELFGKIFTKDEGKEVAGFGKIFSDLGEMIQKGLGSAGEYLGKFRDKIVEFLTPAKEFVQSKFHETVEKIGDAFDKLKGKKPSEVFVEITNAFKDIPIVSKGMEAFGTLIEKIEPIFTKISDKIKGFADQVKQSFKEGGIGAAIETVLSPLNKLKESITDFISKIDIKNPFKSLADFFSNLKNSTSGITSKIVGNIASFFDAVSKFVKGITPEKIMQLGGFAASFIGFISAVKMMSGIGKVTSSASELFDALTENVIGRENKLRDAAILIGVVAGALVSLTASVKILGGMDTGDLVKGELAVAAIAGIVVAFTKLVDGTKDLSLGSIVLLTGAVIALCNEIEKLSDIPWENLLAATASLDSVILSLGGSLKLMSGFQSMTFGGFLEAVIMLGGVVFALKFLTDGTNDFDGMLKASGALSLALLSVGGTLAIITNFASNSIAAKAAIKNFDLFLADLVAVLVVLGALDQIPGFSKIVEDGGGVLAKVGYAIGNFVGSIIGGLAGGVSSGLPEVGKNLSSFMNEAGDFFDKIGNYDLSKIGSGLNDLVSALAQATANNAWDTIISFFTGQTSMEKLGSDLSQFADAIIAYVNKMNGANITDGAITNSTKAATALVELKNTLPAENGIFQLFSGFKDWSNFVYGLDKFAEGIIAFATRPWESINLDRIDAAKGVVEQMVAIKALLPDEGGVLQFFSGSGRWDLFGKGLDKFADAIIGFANKGWNSVDLTVMKGIAENVKPLAELKDALPLEGGIISIFTGFKDWSTFSYGLDTFGTAIIKFAGLGWSKGQLELVKTAVDICKKVVKLKDSLPDSSFLELFDGYDKWTLFSQGLDGFGTAVIKFATLGWASVNSESMTKATEVVAALKEMKASLPEESFINFFIGRSSWTTFSNGLVSFANALAAYNAVVSSKTFDSAAITSSVTAAKSLADMGSIVGTTDGLLGSVVNFFVGGNIDYDGFKTNLIKFAEALKGYSDAVVQGLDLNAMTSSVTAAKTLVTLVQTVNNGQISQDMTDKLNQFGENLLIFINKIITFGTIAAGINFTSIDTVITNVEKLVKMITGMSTMDISGADAMKTAIETLASTSITEFCNTFVNSSEQVNSAIDTMVGYAIAELTAKAVDFVDTGAESMTQFIAGITQTQEQVNSTVTAASETANQTMLTSVQSGGFSNTGIESMHQFMLGVQNTQSQVTAMVVSVATASVTSLTTYIASGVFLNAGTQAMQLFANGITTASVYATNAAQAMVTQVVAYTDNAKLWTYNSGLSAGYGFANGIYASADAVQNAANYVASIATNTINAALDINSPSRVWAEIGRFADMGLAKGITNNSDYAIEAAEELAICTTDAVSDAIADIDIENNPDFDLSPSITPVLDLSEVLSDYEKVNNLIGDSSLGIEALSGYYNSNSDLLSAIAGINSTGGDTYGDVQIIINTQPGMDPNQIADLTLRKLDHQMRRRKAVTA